MARGRGQRVGGAGLQSAIRNALTINYYYSGGGDGVLFGNEVLLWGSEEITFND